MWNIAQKDFLNIDLPSDPAIPSLPKRNKNKHSHKNFYTHSHSRVIHNSPKKKITQMSISGWMNKSNVVYSHDEYYLAIKGNEALIHTTHCKVDEPQKCYAK